MGEIHHLRARNDDMAHHSKSGANLERLNQQAIEVRRICGITILLVMIAASTALGSHLDSSTPSSGPPPIQKPQQALKLDSPTPKTHVSWASARTSPEKSSLTVPPTIPTVAEQNKNPAKPQATLGWQYLLNGQPQDAMAAYREALRQNPWSASAYLGLGISLKNLGEVELAKKALLKAVNLDPRLSPALVHLGYLYAEGHFGQADLQTARRLFQEASQLGDPFATIALLDMKSRSKL
jgi:tetratricopeptide (TPR) repeat protein